MREKYRELKDSNARAIRYEKWTAENEEELTELKNTEIQIEDTALGRRRRQQQEEALAVVGRMEPEDRQRWLAQFKDRDGTYRADGADD
jgi:hypothetical protein